MPEKKKVSLKERLKFAKPKLSPTRASPPPSASKAEGHIRNGEVTKSGAWVFEDVKIRMVGLMLDSGSEEKDSLQETALFPPPGESVLRRSRSLIERERIDRMKEEARKEKLKTLRKMKLDDLEVLEDVGAGASAHVKKAIHKASKIPLALKVIPLGRKDVKPKVIVSEVKTLFEAQHPNILQLYDAFHKDGWIYVAVEYMDLGSLKDVLDVYHKTSEDKYLPEIVLADIFLKVVQGLDHLHRKCNTIHRDIKPENILINSEGEVKLSDFGMAAKLKEQNKRDTFQGTMVYMSPERLRGDGHSYSSDIWSLGLTMATCALGRFPLYKCDGSSPPSFFELLEQVTTVERIPLVETVLSPELCEFIWACTKQNPEKRPSTTELLDMDFLRRHRERVFQLDQWLLDNAAACLGS